jgi:hypothetical protein
MKLKRILTCLLYLVSFLLLSLTQPVNAQQPTLDEALEKEGCVTNEQSQVKLCKYDYLADGKKIEAFMIRPLADGKYPGLVILSGREGAKTSFTFATILARQGFACLAISPLA